MRHPLEPDEFERRWHEALLTLMQGLVRPAITETFAERALARFPDEPQFLLARAIAADQRSASAGPSPAAVTQPTLSRAIADRIAQRYDEAIRFPEVAIEARIRKAWLLYRTGRLEEALALFDSSGAQVNRDPALRFLDHLLRGHVLVALDRSDAAIAAYRAALVIGPSAQSARVALMNVLLARGDRQEAEALAERDPGRTADESRSVVDVLAGTLSRVSGGDGPAAGDDQVRARRVGRADAVFSRRWRGAGSTAQQGGSQAERRSRCRRFAARSTR